MQTSFDGEGVATHKKSIIENGVLKTLLYDLTTAKKAGVVSTGNGQKRGYSSPVTIAPYSYCIHADEHSREELFTKMQNGIDITECKGFHA
jgi:PmbA protein